MRRRPGIDYDDHHRHSHYIHDLERGSAGLRSEGAGTLIALIARWHRKGDPDPSELGDLECKGDGERLLLLYGVIRLVEQLERSRDGSIATVQIDDREPCVILRPVTDGGPQSDASVAIWSA